MSNGQVPLDSLLAAKRIYEAIRQLEAMKKSGARVYGLDEDIANVKALVSRVEGLVNNGDQLFASGDARHACVAYEQAIAIAADHPDAQSKLAQATERYELAQEQLNHAQKLMNRGELAAALNAVNLSLHSDRTSRTANALRTRLIQVTEAARASRRKRRFLIIGGCGAAAAAVVIGVALFIIVMVNQSAATRRDQALAQVDQLLLDADRQIAVEAFTDAKASLDQALELAQRLDPSPQDRIKSIQSRQSGPVLMQGLDGRVSYGGQWLAITERAAILARRDQLTGDLDALVAVLQDRIDGRIPGIPPLTDLSQQAELYKHIADTHRIRPMVDGGRFDQATMALNELMPRVDASLSQSGLEKYKNRWYTPTAALEQRMADQGLVRYGDKWVTPEKKEEAEMTARGFVRHEGNWVTPQAREEAVMTARGLVRHEGQWMTPADKFAAEQKARGLEWFEGKWLATADVRRIREVRLARLAQIAYAMATEFVKDSLKAPATAVFPHYRDSNVSVHLDDKTGHFIVTGYVDSQNGFGAMLRTNYICELWPTDDEAENWKSNAPIFLSQ